ncbi:MAG: F0F1 ATP synthase subunit A [Chloroflexi bacterium]|nr:F0F1 ATP synthase subunit A [Chloroflexota bacterium]
MRAALIGVLALVALAVGMLVLTPPSPAIIVAPETVFHVGPLDVTNTMFTSWVVLALMTVVAVVAARGFSVVPSGFSGAVEALVGGFYNVVVGVVGEAQGRRFFWVVGTIFFWVLLNNYAGLLPGNLYVGVTEPGHGETQAVFEQASLLGVDLAYIPIGGESVDVGAGDEPIAPEKGGDPFSGIIAPLLRSVMTDVNAPLAIAIFSFIFVEYWGISTLGVGYFGKFFNFRRLLRGNPMGLIDVFVGILELISEFIRVVSFTFRLFGNIFAGEVLIVMMSFLVPLLLVTVFYGLELFVGLIQAFVFAMLTLVFAQMAVAHHGGGEEGHGAAGH